MTEQGGPARLQAVENLRVMQRNWLRETRESTARGAPFAICNGDDCEEIFNIMGIPVLVINYWNYLIAFQRKTDHFHKILHDRGYPGNQFLAMGWASAIDPAEAPWGGLPRPTVIVGANRDEQELRISEMWAREFGCPVYPLDFNLSTPINPPPDDWYDYTWDRWEELIDPHRLEFRMEQEKAFIRYLEDTTGLECTYAMVAQGMELLNEQMDYWARARELIASARRCPVHIRDQMSMYQSMWHRATPRGVKLVKDYYEELKHRVETGIAAHKHEKTRLFYHGSLVPPWSSQIEEKYGAITVASAYAGFPNLYARRIKDGNPLKTLAARHLFLFDRTPSHLVHEATFHRCDAVIAIHEQKMDIPSADQLAAEKAGLPYCIVPRDADDPEVIGIISEFLETRMQ